jgi:pyrroline-5-carboxylate reductase
VLEQTCVGIIGVGKMGGGGAAAIAHKAGEVWAYDTDGDRLAAISRQLNLHQAGGNGDLVSRAGAIILAVKPKEVAAVLEEVRPALRPEKVLISIAAGVTTERISGEAGERVQVVRAMPNVLATVGESSTAVASDSPADQQGLELAKEIFACAGRVVTVPEALLNAVTGLSGSGPAFVFTFIEALADGGVAAGLPRQQAIELAAQTVLGAAKMVLEGHGHPAALRDMVTSPGGTTIAGLGAMESRAFRAACMEAVQAAAKRAAELAKA